MNLLKFYTIAGLTVCLLLLLGLFCFCRAEQSLKASWYSIESLKQEGTFKYSKGVMANGRKFIDTNFTCATRLYPLGSILYVSYGNKTVRVVVTDRIGKRFAKTRVDLSKSAFQKLADLKQGIIPIKVRKIGGD